MVRQTLTVDGLLAVEWCDLSSPWPQVMEREARRFARVLGSDCHTFRGPNPPGGAYTWVKMASPTVEGLKLALLDGNGVSIQRSDEGAFDPLRVPAHLITAIEIENARYMGNGQAARLTCTPFFNAVIGGRGTGKSTVVHALRLAAQRDQELAALGQASEAGVQFEAFRKAASGREDKGALRTNTVIRVEWRHEDLQLRLLWRPDLQSTTVEEWRDGGWQLSASQSVNAARFPLRIFSQGQIGALASGGRQTLLSIIDEAANVEPMKQAFAESRRTFFTQRAKLRELDGKLAGLAEVVRRMDEVGKKLTAFSSADHAAVLHAYAQAQHQVRDVKALLEQLKSSADLIAALPATIALDEWRSQNYAEQDSDVLTWREGIDRRIEQVRLDLQIEARNLYGFIESIQNDDRYMQWRTRAKAADTAHISLQQQLAQQGVSDPQAFARLTQEHQQLELQVKALQQLQGDRAALLEQIRGQEAMMAQERQRITQARQAFIQETLSGNPHVRMAVVPFGFDPRQIEREVRELIDVPDERFTDDILVVDDGEPSKGLAFELAQSDDQEKAATLIRAKQRLLDADAALGGRLRNYLQRKHEKPEFGDHVLSWFPEDDLRIEYQREGRWTSISQGSQGQRSAALLAFLLAFGEEPIVLDQPEDDLDNHLIYDLIVRQLRENKLRRQLIVVTHNPNVVVNGDADLVHVMEFGRGQCFAQHSGALQEASVRREVCRVMEGGQEAFAKRWKRLGSIT
jgi:energy-coupling factor transporter ATP-binding protein EcfA2